MIRTTGALRLAVGVTTAALAATLHAQAPGPRDSAARAPKSPTRAALLGFVLPGAGHWYAGEAGRGTAIAAVYWTGVAIVAGGRTDRTGQVGGLLLLGALGTSVIDGAHAARRWNSRVHVGARPADPGSGALLEAHVTVAW